MDALEIASTRVWLPPAGGRTEVMDLWQIVLIVVLVVALLVAAFAALQARRRKGGVIVDPKGTAGPGSGSTRNDA